MVYRLEHCRAVQEMRGSNPRSAKKNILFFISYFIFYRNKLNFLSELFLVYFHLIYSYFEK